MDLGLKIKEARIDRNLTQEYVADKIGMSTSNYGKIENGKIDVNFSTLEKVCQIMKINIWEIVAKGYKMSNNEQTVSIISDTVSQFIPKTSSSENVFMLEKIELLERIIEDKNKALKDKDTIIALLKTK